MSKTQRYIVGSNMPGYMPDEVPYKCGSISTAIGCLLDDARRALDEELDGDVDAYDDRIDEASAAIAELVAAPLAQLQEGVNLRILGRVFWARPRS